MITVSQSNRKPLNRWNYDYIAPGAVGVIGTTAVSHHLATTGPLGYRDDPDTAGNRVSNRGSCITDGTSRSFLTGGGPPRVYSTAWTGGRSSNYKNITRVQNIRPNQLFVSAESGNLPQFSAALITARTTEPKKSFFNIPSEGLITNLGTATRGGNYPTITNTESTEMPINYKPSMTSTQQRINSYTQNIQYKKTGLGVPSRYINS